MYAVRKDGLGWRAVNSQGEVDAATEDYAQEMPLPTLAALRANAVQDIKAEAGRIILARLPTHQQANMTARAVELLSAGDTGGPEWAAIQSDWAWVKAVRRASNVGEAAVLSATLSAAAIEAAKAAAVAAMAAEATPNR